MSKIGRQPIEIPDGVKVEVGDNLITVSGPKGTQNLKLRPEIKVFLEGGEIRLKRMSDKKIAKSLHGLTRTLIYNMVVGVSQGWEKALEIIGTGFGVKISNGKLILNLGYSHPIEFVVPPDVKAEVFENKIKIEGCDKAKVGEVAAQIRSLRPPDVYKGKGIRYLSEVVKLKPGKAAKAVGLVAKV